MLHQIGRKLRIQINLFSGELSAGLGKVTSRFVEEMIYGICASGSVLLSEVARALEEPIEMHATHKRLSANLSNGKIERTIAKSVLAMGAKRIKKDTLLIVDPSDITKKYARKMEYLAEVRDASEKKIGDGYWLCEVVGCEHGKHEITPLAQILWSQKAPDFVSENTQILSLVDKVLSATEHRGILVYDRGGDRREFLIPWTQDARVRYLVRQRGDRHLLYNGMLQAAETLANMCKTPYAESIVKEVNGKEKYYFIDFGFVPVRLPEVPDRPLWLVVVKGFGNRPMMLLTTEPMRRNRTVLWWAVEAYLTRWRVEDTIRFIKQSYDLENVRVLTYQRLKNLVTLLLAVSYFTAAWIGSKSKLKILMMHGFKAAKRIFGVPDFKYYALSDGMKHILSRTKRLTRSHCQGLAPPLPELPLFD